jgi:hypothetical protein
MGMLARYVSWQWKHALNVRIIQSENSRFSLIIKSMPPVSSSKSQPKYTKNAKVGEMVHLKCVHVTVEAQQCKCWYGRLWKEKWVLQNIKKASQQSKPMLL